MNNCFALYRLPGDNKVTVVRQDDDKPETLLSCEEMNGKQGFAFAPFCISVDNPLLIIRPDHVETIPVENEPQFAETQFQARDIRKERDIYGQTFRKFHERLSDGTFKKLVLSRCSDETAEQLIDPEQLFHRACSLYPHQFVALVSTPQSGTWLMATPEILIKADKDIWRTMALAGTLRGDRSSDMPSAKNVTDDTAAGTWDKKNIEEQRYVSEYIRKCLERFSDDINETEPYTYRAAQVSHLNSDFTFTLRNKNALGNLVEELYPTPAVCGLPKQEACKFIVSTEQHERSYYSGFAGPLNLLNTTHLYVTLRCMQISGRHFKLYAGGGILKESEEEKEWLETEAKMETMRRCLAIRRI